jgi:hypothetical protein
MIYLALGYTVTIFQNLLANRRGEFLLFCLFATVEHHVVCR